MVIFIIGALYNSLVNNLIVIGILINQYASVDYYCLVLYSGLVFITHKIIGENIMSPKQDFNAVLTARLSAIQDKKDVVSGHNWTLADKQKIVLALMDKIQADVKKDGRYMSYTGRFIILTALRKYGPSAVNQFKTSTLVQACKDYSLEIQAILK